HARWDRHLAVAPEERMQEKIGPVARQYADKTRAAYVLHMLDEFIHHGAEVGVLRDLWRWQHGMVTDDVLVDRVIRGGAGVLGAPARHADRRLTAGHASNFARVRPSYSHLAARRREGVVADVLKVAPDARDRVAPRMAIPSCGAMNSTVAPSGAAPLCRQPRGA